MLFAREACERLEPVGVVRGTLLDGPLLHRVRDHVGDLDVERLAAFDGAHERLVRDGRQALRHHVLVEHHGSIDFGYVRRHAHAPCSALFA